MLISLPTYAEKIEASRTRRNFGGSCVATGQIARITSSYRIFPSYPECTIVTSVSLARLKDPFENTVSDAVSNRRVFISVTKLSISVKISRLLKVFLASPNS